MYRLERWDVFTRMFWAVIILAACGFAATRLFLLVQLGPAWESLDPQETGRAFFMGLRFDLKWLAIFLLPWMGLSFLFYWTPKRVWAAFFCLFCCYSVIVLLGANVLSVINHYYFSFYQSPINALVFGFAEDDTRAILKTVWHDFPVLRATALVLVVSAIQFYLALRFGKKKPFLRPLTRWVRNEYCAYALLILLNLVVLIGFARGSLGTFPLRATDLSVSRNMFVNNIVPNAFYALLLAMDERNSSNLGTDPEAQVKKMGFGSWQDAARYVYGTSAGDNSEEESFRLAKWAQLPINKAAEENPPHVVFALMESWGRQPLEYDDAGRNDLLGKLRPWLSQKGDYFDHAISAEHGTHPSLEAILLDSPMHPLTDSNYGYISYDTSRIAPYKQAGYRTVFLTSGSSSWRKINPALLRQGFDEIHDENHIRARFPKATRSTWGIDDEWMFRYGADLLKEADRRGEKVMLFMLSITNHPPYRVPAHYTPGPLDTAALGKDMASDALMGESILQTYQYANNSLGEFLDTLEQDALLDKTLVVATGDHNTRTLLAYPDNSKLYYKFGVPILFYIPPGYRQPAQIVDHAAWSSHQDIFPTLWAHSLSNVTVPLGGRNLYTPAVDEGEIAFSFAFNDGGKGIMISKEGAICNIARPSYYVWNEAGELVPTQTPPQQLVQQGKTQAAKLALQDWRIRQQALKK